ncbi:MAG: hypothetical protein KAU10_03040, partial [Dehalococcoidia bacterium]|nr:hypothetical protein [Dehalococcoidia bacterium]
QQNAVLVERITSDGKLHKIQPTGVSKLLTYSAVRSILQHEDNRDSCTWELNLRRIVGRHKLN